MRKNSAGLPVITISRRGADRIRAGHVWVYRSDVSEGTGICPGALVTVQEAPDKSAGPARPSSRGRSHGGILGTAFYSTASEIAIRMISPGPVSDLDQLLRDRIREAISYRERFVQNSNAYRVIFSEADFLPGLIVDRYNDILSLQVLTQAIDAEHIRQLVLSELAQRLQPSSIVEKIDARVRRLEQLPEKESGIVWSRASGEEARLFEEETIGSVMRDRGETGIFPVVSAAPRPPVSPITTEFQMNGVRFVYDALSGQKTGAFLDQRENYAAAAQYARGEALDVFCYQGGFALHLAPKCDKVTGIDSSRPALEIADKNAQLNGKEIEWIEANAFDLLRDYSDTGRKYACIVLDPPAFAKSRRDLPTALRGYKELNLRALKMLRPGGILITCSCSYHVSASDLAEVIAAAAHDSHRIVRILENRAAAKDHPNVLGVPETAYLKCIIMLVS